MSVLDRYKKPGGFVQLLTLLETCGPQKKEKFLQMILEENPAWYDSLKQRLLSLERILAWPNEFLTEVTTRALPITLAAISKSLPEQQNKRLFHGLSHSQFAKVREISENKQFTPAEISSSIEKLLGDTRGLMQQGIIKVEKFDADLAIPDNVEDLLLKKLSGLPPLPPPEVFAEKATIRTTTTAVTPNNNQGTNAPVNDESATLRRQNLQLQQELQQLRQENMVLKDKLERIKKIA